jgi:hypothetical protein
VSARDACYDSIIGLPPPDLSIDLRDAVGDRLHLSDDFVKDGVSYRLFVIEPILTKDDV